MCSVNQSAIAFVHAMWRVHIGNVKHAVSLRNYKLINVAVGFLPIRILISAREYQRQANVRMRNAKRNHLKCSYGVEAESSAGAKFAYPQAVKTVKSRVWENDISENS